MSLKLLLLLLPALAHARIRVSVRASGTESEAKVEYFGSNVAIVSDKEIQTFGLSDDKLKDAVRNFAGRRPDDVFLKSPTPWNDIYKSYGWNQVKRTLFPYKARILGIKSEPVIMTTQEFVNNSTVRAKYNAGVTQQVEETVSSTWTKGGELTVGQEITYSVDLKVAEVGGTLSIAYAASWGEETSKSKAVTLGSSSAVEVELAPGQSVLASLQATRGSMEIQVDYSANLDGDVVCNYERSLRGHHFWRFDMNVVQSSGNLKTSVESTEIITIGFYSDAKVTVTDKRSKRTIRSVPAEFL